MTILGYSGGGRGGRGRGRGRGRDAPSYRGRGTGRFAFSFQQRHHPSYPTPSGQSARKWVRKNDPEDGPDDEVEDSKERIKQESNFVKRGKNQLVLKVANDDSESVTTKESQFADAPGESDPEETSTACDSRDAKSADKSANDEIIVIPVGTKDQSSQSTTSMSASLRRIARNKLVVANSSSRSSGSNNETSWHLKKVASNKLVAPGSRPVPIVGRPRRHHPAHFRGHANQRKRPPPRKPQPSAKRIAIEVSQSQSNDSQEDDSSTGRDETATGEAGSEPTEKLTDFAYRETSRRVQHESKSLKWSATGNNNSSSSSSNTNKPTNSLHQAHKGPIRRNMGLVRVPPKADKTPICKKFLRGVVCTDQYCKKRHDVPKEFAMPVCSFFQRHGNCLKGEDCPFRHIKVNPRAMVCPSFQMLGFCDDTDCKMKHERARNK